MKISTRDFFGGAGAFLINPLTCGFAFGGAHFFICNKYKYPTLNYGLYESGGVITLGTGLTILSNLWANHRIKKDPSIGLVRVLVLVPPAYTFGFLVSFWTTIFGLQGGKIILTSFKN